MTDIYALGRAAQEEARRLLQAQEVAPNQPALLPACLGFLERLVAAYDKALDEPSADEDDSVFACESCYKKADFETMTSAGDGCYICAECYASWKKGFDACDHDWKPGHFEGDEGMTCEKCSCFKRELPAPPSSPPADNAALIAALEDINGRTCANVVLHANAMVLQSICADCHQISGAALSAAPAKPAASDADLVKEAREIAADMYVGAVARDVIETLANRIEALSAKVEKVERERDMRAASECWYAARLHTSNGQLQRESDARNAAEKERDEARAALRKAHTALHGYGCIDTALAAIRAALSAAPSQQEPTRAAKAGEAG